MIDSFPKYVNRQSRHGHNLSHDFSFTSSTGHLLTLFATRLDPKDTIQGKVDMFTRTQPLLNAANLDIEEFIDYFFVPLEMLYSGFGDYIYQVNEPYSKVTQANLASQQGKLPILDWESAISGVLSDVFYQDDTVIAAFNSPDQFEFDTSFMSIYRNLFHNYYNPNALFKYVLDHRSDQEAFDDYVVPVDCYQPNVMPIYLMAYNAVYEHFYRLDDREEFDSGLYNIDSVVYDGDFLHEDFSKYFYELKYRPLFFDYFTSAKVAPLINDNNILSQNASTDLLRINNYLSSRDIQLSAPSGGSVTDISDSSQVRPSSNTALSTGSLRSMFAVEKLLSITNRSKKTYDAQVLAHLGVDMPIDYFHNIQFIGSQRSSIHVGEVISTAGTEDTPLGDIAGKGYSQMGGDGVKFTAPCHGVFIAIYSAVPRVRYYAPLEKHAMVTDRLSFFHPEFEKQGMQPIFGYEAFAIPDADYSSNTTVLGWQMRYEELKKRFNKVSPAFVDTIIAGVDDQGNPLSYVKSFNQWHNWVLVRRPYGFESGPDSAPELRDFLCSPTMLNGLMAADYLDWSYWNRATGMTRQYWYMQAKNTPYAQRTSFVWNVGSMFMNDPLIHFASNNFKLVNKISEDTLVPLGRI